MPPRPTRPQLVRQVKFEVRFTGEASKKINALRKSRKHDQDLE